MGFATTLWGSNPHNLWQLCSNLPEHAFRCGDWMLFDHQEWQPIRDSAQNLLGLMECLEIQPYLDDLTVDCCNEVNGDIVANSKRT